MEVAAIADEEFVLRRIPPVTFKDGVPKISLKGRFFKLRDGEDGLSVNCERLISPVELLALPGCLEGSAVARAQVVRIRQLGFAVLDRPVENSPGHAEIVAITADFNDIATRDLLCGVFALVE
jgi:hypothetical protein